MLITLKTLQEDAFTVEIDPLQTIRCFKEKIEKVKGENFPAKHMKLMYAGKFLLDNNRVCDYNLQEKMFVIAVIKPPKSKVIRVEEPTPLDMSLINRASNSFEGEHALCPNHEMLVQRIAELGFTRAEVEHALRASFNHPDRAVDYLISNICAGVGSSDANSPNNDPRPGYVPVYMNAAGLSYVGGYFVKVIEREIKSIDCINEVLIAVHDAHFLHQISQAVPSSSSNSILPSQERIFELFSEAVTECENHTRAENRMIEANHQHIVQSYAELEACGISDPHEIFSRRDAERSNSLGPYAECLQTVQTGPGEFGAQGYLLDRDQEAIDRLKQLGFSDQKVVEAYFVCDKNENAAADYLFTQFD